MNPILLPCVSCADYTAKFPGSSIAAIHGCGDGRIVQWIGSRFRGWLQSPHYEGAEKHEQGIRGQGGGGDGRGG